MWGPNENNEVFICQCLLWPKHNLHQRKCHRLLLLRTVGQPVGDVLKLWAGNKPGRRSIINKWRQLYTREGVSWEISIWAGDTVILHHPEGLSMPMWLFQSLGDQELHFGKYRCDKKKANFLIQPIDRSTSCLYSLRTTVHATKNLAGHQK